VPDVERMLALLGTQDRAAGDVTLHVEPGAEHDERAWRAEFARAVAWLFDLPPPGTPAR
jgi:hypothetical protein